MSGHTPGPWHWRRAENGEGSQEWTLVGSPDDWRKCEYFCFGWPPEGSECSRGEAKKPGHEHNHAPTVLAAMGWHGSGDLVIDTNGPDACLIASAPDLLTALEEIKKKVGMATSQEIYAIAEAAIAKVKP